MKVLAIALLLCSSLLAETFTYAPHQLEQIKQHRQSEVRTEFSRIRAAELAWLAETGSYSTALIKTGYLPLPGEHAYIFGFSRASEDAPNDAKTTMEIFEQFVRSTRGSLGFFENTDPETGRKLGGLFSFWFNPALNVQSIDFAANAGNACGKQGCTATKTGYRVLAIGNLDADPKLDAWILDEKNTITHLQDDASE